MMDNGFSSLRETVSGAVSVSEFRSRLAEIIGRVEQGQEVLIARRGIPIAKLVPLQGSSKRRLGVLKDKMGEEALAALEAPLSAADQAALEGGLTNNLGIAER